MQGGGPELRQMRRYRFRQAQIRRRRAAALIMLGLFVMVVVWLVTSAGGGPEQVLRKGLPSAPVRFTVEANGDLLIHTPVWMQAQSYGGGSYDFKPMLELVKPYVSGADLAICHVETPMTSAPPQGYPVFNTPPALAGAIKATGWDLCETASNHSLDQGQEGIDETGRVLDSAGLKHTGSSSSAAQQRKIVMARVKGIKVALLAYTEMTNGIPLPNPWSVNLATDVNKILADARRARKRGAQVVIVNLHAGEEYQSEPSQKQMELAERLTRARVVTAVIGQHVHVVQPIRRINRKFVVFGEGNLLSNQTADCCPAQSQDGIIVLLDFLVDGRGAKVVKVRYVPTWVSHPDFTVLPVGDALKQGKGDAALLSQSYERTVSVVGRGPRIEPVPARLP